MGCSSQLATLGISMTMTTRTREGHLPKILDGPEFHLAGHKLFGLYFFCLEALGTSCDCSRCVPTVDVLFYCQCAFARLCAADASVQPSQVTSLG